MVCARRRRRAGRNARTVWRSRRARPRSTTAGSRAEGATFISHRPARRATAHGLHALPLRRLHAARSQRDDRPQRIHCPRPPVPRRAKASRAPRSEIMMGRSEHLHDDRLVECYFADRRGEPLDPPSAEHLVDCEACGTRYVELVTFLDDVRTESDAECDAVFTPDRLRQQQDQILKRLEHASRSARVISFPGQAASHPSAVSGRVAPRWLAAAAAAGLFVGVAVSGTILRPGGQRVIAPMRVATGPSAAARLAPSPAVLVNAPANTLDSIDDDAFLMQLEF